MSDDPQGMVSVPRALLAAVLDQAESDSHSTQAEFSCSEEQDKRYAEERAHIAALREAAGLTSEGATGQGFFGVALALKDQK